MSNADLQTLIEAAWERRTELSPGSDRKVADAVDEVLAGLDSGALRVAEKAGGDLFVHQLL
jgi:2,3,4,5-tetrahydropyridine-2-carboxylate N-succinyltransferase